MRSIYVLIFIFTLSFGFERKSLEFRSSLQTLSGKVSRIFQLEYQQYEETGRKSRKLQTLMTMLRPSISVLRQEVENLSFDQEIALCILCRSAVTVLIAKRKLGASDKTMRELSVKICVGFQITTEKVCEKVIDKNIESILYIFDNTKNLTDASVCGVLLQGSNCQIDQPEFSWSIDVDNQGPIINEHKNDVPSESVQDLVVLQLTDIHFDLLYKVGSISDCAEPMCCHEDSTPKSKILAKKSAGYWSDYNSCDIPWWFVEDSIRQIRAQHPKIDLIYLTGDLVDHGVWNTSVIHNKETISRVNNLIKKVFKGIPVLPVVGNHESHVVNLFAPDYIRDKNLTTNWLYDYLADEWYDWLPSSAIETVRKRGYYSVTPKKGLRVIVLNNNECYTFNFWLLNDPRYLSKQFFWLHEAIKKAEKNGEKVHILQHLPSGSGSYFNTCAREFRRIIDRFHKTISGIFVAHTHFDEFNIYYSINEPSYAINVAWNGGSLTPYGNLNPNYRIYKVSPTTFDVVGHETWISNLTAANLEPNESPIWFKEYNLKEKFELENLSPSSLNDLINRFASNRDLLKQYWRLKIKNADPSLSKGCDNKCLEEHLCEIVTTQFNDAKKCDELVAIFNKTS